MSICLRRSCCKTHTFTHRMHSSPLWHHIHNEADIPSPALLLFKDSIEHNLQLMVRIAGGPERLRPHVKTHKLAPLVTRQLELGITKFKCATLAEAEMCAAAGAPDVILAMPCVGHNAHRFAQLLKAYPRTQFSTIVDDKATLAQLAIAVQQSAKSPGIFMDIDCGMGRTGILPGDEAAALAHHIASTPGVHLAGLHAYDGHIHESDPAQREAICEASFSPVLALRDRLNRDGLLIKELVAGGSPTFPFHAQHTDRTHV